MCGNCHGSVGNTELGLYNMLYPLFGGFIFYKGLHFKLNAACNTFLFISLVLLSMVKEARRGANTEGFKSSGKTYEDERCFSIIYGSDYKTLDLVCQNADEARIWINGIKALKHHTGM